MSEMCWIPVSERLPPNEGWIAVLAANRNGVFVTTTHPSWWNHKDERGREYDGPNVTHWMFLPAPPK